MIKIKNNKQISDVWVGQLIEANQHYELPNADSIKWANNSKVLTDIGNGDLIVNDNDVDLVEVADAINVLKGELPKDENGRQLVRTVAGSSGWKAQFHSVRVTTSTVDGFYNKDKNGNNLGFCTYTMYDVNNQVTAVENDCVKTVVTWEPNHDIEIIGGKVSQRQAPATDVWMYITAAAHIPAQYGGNIAFAEGGINLYDVGEGGKSDFDGRASKFIKYDPVYHSGRFEILIKHDAGIKHSFSLILEIFKP
jgi:hypothetical protein